MVYFIHSINDEYFSKQVALLTKNSQMIEFDLEPNRLISVINEIKTIDLFNEKRSFLLNNANFFQIKSHKFKKKEVEHFIEAINTSEDTIIINLSKKINYKNNYINSILKKEYIELIDEEKVGSYFLNLFIENQEILIGKQELDLIKYNLNNNILAIENELLKLQSFMNNTPITIDTINEFGISSVEANSFNLLELILKGKHQQAKNLYDHIIIGGTNPVSLLGLVSTQVRFLYQVKILSEKHNAYEISQVLKANNYRVKITLKQVNTYSIHHLSNFYLKIAQLDFLIKSGKLNQELIFDYLLY